MLAGDNFVKLRASRQVLLLQQGVVFPEQAILGALAPGQHLKVLFVDQGYTGERFALGVLQLVGAKVEVVKRKASGFEVLPKRWIVERTLSWLAQNRRLSKDHELLL